MIVLKAWKAGHDTHWWWFQENKYLSKKNVLFPLHFSELSIGSPPLSYVPVPMWLSTHWSASLCSGSSSEHQDHRNSHSLYLACGLIFVRIPQACSSFTSPPTVDFPGGNVLKKTRKRMGRDGRRGRDGGAKGEARGQVKSGPRVTGWSKLRKFGPCSKSPKKTTVDPLSITESEMNSLQAGA